MNDNTAAELRLLKDLTVKEQVNQLAQYNLEIKRLEKLRNLLKEKLRNRAMQTKAYNDEGVKIYTGDDFQVVVTKESRTSLDTVALKAELDEETLEPYWRTTEFSKMSVMEKEGDDND